MAQAATPDRPSKLASFVSRMSSSKSHMQSGFERFKTLPEEDKTAICAVHREAQHIFATCLNVGDLDTLDATLADWEERLATNGGALRLSDIATQMVWNYAAPDYCQAERAGASRVSMHDFIKTFEDALSLKPDSPYIAAILANSYIELAQRNKLIEKNAAQVVSTSSDALDRAKTVLLAHSPEMTVNRMVAMSWYRLQAAMAYNCEAFSKAFERCITLDPSDLEVYRIHGSQITQHCGDNFSRVEASAQAALATNGSVIGNAGYTLFIMNALAHSNEPLCAVKMEPFKSGFAKLIEISADPQFELSRAAYLAATMARRVDDSRSIGSHAKKVAGTLRGFIREQVDRDLTCIRMDAWGQSRPQILHGMKAIYTHS